MFLRINLDESGLAKCPSGIRRWSVNNHQKQRANLKGLSERAAECLRRAGWTPARTVSTRVYEDAYQTEGRTLLPKTKEFLRNFGGLIIPYLTSSQREDVLAFLADREVHAMDRNGVECFEELTGAAPLCPIGHYQFGTCILFMDKRGYVFGGSDETVTLIGRTGEEAVGNILSGTEAQVIEPRSQAG
jgi:hypothetical protein